MSQTKHLKPTSHLLNIRVAAPCGVVRVQIYRVCHTLVRYHRQLSTNILTELQSLSKLQFSSFTFSLGNVVVGGLSAESLLIYLDSVQVLHLQLVSVPLVDISTLCQTAGVVILHV